MQMNDNEIVASYQRAGCSKAQITILAQLNRCGIKRIEQILGKKILCCATTQQRTQIAKKSN